MDCDEVFKEVVYLYNNAHVLARVWDDIEPDRRLESIDNLREKMVALNDKKHVQPEDSTKVFEMLNKLEQQNNKDVIPSQQEVEEPIITMALNSILTCGCREDGVIVEWDKGG
jgi:hypothetical protein